MSSSLNQTSGRSPHLGEQPRGDTGVVLKHVRLTEWASRGGMGWMAGPLRVERAGAWRHGRFKFIWAGRIGPSNRGSLAPAPAARTRWPSAWRPGASRHGPRRSRNCPWPRNSAAKNFKCFMFKYDPNAFVRRSQCLRQCLKRATPMPC